MSAPEEWPKACTCDRKTATRDEFMRLVGECVEHGGLWSYKCGACRDHSKRMEAFTLTEAEKKP